MSITTLIKTIQDIMRKDVGVDGDAQRISQMVWLLFLKIFDDKEQEWQLTEKGYKSPLQSRFRWSNWAKDPEGITGEELIDFVNNDLFPTLKKMATTAGTSPRGKVVGSVFEDAYNYMKSGTLLRQVINTIEEDVDFNSSKDRHLFNDIYEKILADLQSAGNAGEYYTPRAVTQFMVDILDPRLGQNILDPACGTGGFLTCAIEHLKKQVKTADDRKCLQENIHGVEKKPLPHMLTMTNMMLHGIDVPTNIRHDNTLSRPLKDYGPKDRVDLIITNPPFGGMEEDGIENNFPRKYQTRETADLFMALIMHLLKPDTGKAAVVLPDGFLFGEGVKTTLKRELLEEFTLHTIVRLPKGVFSPYTSISTNILFFEKGGPTREVWFFEHPYPKGYKSYSRSKPLTIAEFDREKAWWGGPERKGRKPTKHAWKISIKELAERNYNLDCKNPHEVEVNHRDPEELMQEFQACSQLSSSTFKEIKSELLSTSDGLKESLDRYFDIAFSAPDGTKRLREVILSMALQGKLCQQDPNDVPASALMKDIEAEKRKLVKEGKIKKLKPLPKVEEKTLCKLPRGWKWSTLAEVSLINPRNNVDESTEVSFVPMALIGTANDGTHEQESRIWSDVKTGFTHFAEGDIGVAKITPCFENSKACIFSNLKNGVGAGTTELHVIRPLGKTLAPRYVLAYLKSPQFLLVGQTKMTGTAGQKRLPRDFVESNPFPLPPISEQYRIIEKIDQLMSLCDLLDMQLATATLKQTELLNVVMAQV